MNLLKWQGNRPQILFISIPLSDIARQMQELFSSNYENQPSFF